MNIMPTMLMGEHTSNCIHNAKEVAKKSLRNFRDTEATLNVRFMLLAKVGAMKGKVKKDKWVSTEGINVFMLNEENTDTMVIQKVDSATNNANIRAMAKTIEYDEMETMNPDWIKAIADAANSLATAANELEKGETHNIQKLTIGCIDIHLFIELARQGYLEVELETNAFRLDTAIPTEIQTLVLAGFGLLNAIEFINILLKDAVHLVKKAIFHAPRELDFNYG